MSTEKLFTVVGTAVNENGTMKVRWANDITSRIKILHKYKCTDINLIELSEGMTKLAALEYFQANQDLTPEQEEVVTLKINEKVRSAKRLDLKTTLTANVKSRVANGKKPTDPSVERFINSTEKTSS